MGVLTTAYSIPPDLMKKIQAYKKNLEKIFNAEEGWRFEDYCFDKSWEEKIRIIGKCYPRTRNRLNHQNCWNYPDYDVWIVKPKDVKFASNDIKMATFESLKKWGNINGEYVADYYSKPIPENLFEFYVGNIETFKEFLRKAADDGNYLLFATG